MIQLATLAMAATSTLLLAGVVQTTPASAPVESTAFHVSPSGSDAASGAPSDPFLTLERARDAVRTEIADGMAHDVAVIVEPGDYFLEEPLSFDERDSGRDGFTVEWVTGDGGAATISGSRVLEGEWEETATPSVLRLAIPAVAAGDWRFDQVFVDGERQRKARYPDDGYLHTIGGADDTRTFYAEPGDLPPWTDLSGAQAVVWSSPYFADTVRIDELEAGEGRVTLADDMLLDFGQGEQRRYYLQGALEALDRPGEFYLDEAEGYLYLWPDTAEFDSATVTAPVIRDIVRFVGSDASTPVTDIRFSGFDIVGSAFTDYFNETRGIEWNRPAAPNAAAAVYLENAERIAVQDNRIDLAGFSGVTLHHSARDNVIQRNEISDFGYHGVLLLGTDSGVRNASGEQVYDNRSNRVADNHIHDGSLVGHGSGIFVHQSGENVIEHNVIHDLPRYGIGSKANRAPSRIDEVTARDNVIRYNDISAVNQESDDTGAITLTSVGPGNVIEANRIHDIMVREAHGGHGHAIYLDNHTQGTHVVGNLVHDVGVEAMNGIHTGIYAKGADNVVENNIVVQSSEKASASAMGNAQHGANDAVAHRYERNILVVEEQGPAVYQFLNWEDENVATSDFNLFSQPSGEYRVTGIPLVADISDWQTISGQRFDQHSILGDPAFRDQADDDFVLDPESPAFALGFEDIDFGRIGTTRPDMFPAGALDRLHVSAAGRTSSIVLDNGRVADLVVVARDSAGLALDPEDLSITYSSANERVAAIDDSGSVRGRGPGRTAITVTADDGSNLREVVVPVYVGDRIGSFALEGDEHVLAVGDDLKLRAIAETVLGREFPLDGASGEVTFSSDDPATAFVGADGVVDAIGVGQANIVARVVVGDLTLTRTWSIEVRERVFREASLTMPTLAVEVGASATLTPLAWWSDGGEIELAGTARAYSSADPSVVDVDADGTVTGVSVGVSRVSVRLTVDGVERSAHRTVYVVEDTEMPDGWSHEEIGPWERQESYASHHDGTWTLNSNAADAWGKRDRVVFVGTEVDPADYPDGFSIIATVEALSQVNRFTMAGVMIRDDLSGPAGNVAPRIRTDGAMPVGLREVSGGATANVSESPVTTFPARLKLTRVGDSVTSWYWEDGAWVESSAVTVEMDGLVHAGIWAASADASGLSEAVFSDVQVIAEHPLPASAESLEELDRLVVTASAFLHDAVAGDGQGEYPQTVIDALTDDRRTAADVLVGGDDVTQPLVDDARARLAASLETFIESRGAVYAFELDFEDEAVGEVPGVITVITPENGAVRIAEDPSGTGQVLQVEGTVHPLEFEAAVPAVEADTARVESRFLADQLSSVSFAIGAGATSQAMYLRFLGNGTIRLIAADGSWTRIGTWAQGVWNEVSVELDFTDQTLDITLNGSVLTTASAFRHTVECVGLVSWWVGPGTYLFDDIRASVPASSDATLADLTVGGTTVPEFHPEQQHYTVAVPDGAGIPVVSARANDPEAGIYSEQASGPGDRAHVVVIAPDRRTALVYDVDFVSAG
ncbi:Ig-like domain-containing protein [Agromyces sp. SYSU T00194]|uniref:Ig-like domain-containing protein n=1 Tax=Agromyces chitinivorans TaxID=3158560 RepID=UPI0033938A9A